MGNNLVQSGGVSIATKSGRLARRDASQRMRMEEWRLARYSPGKWRRVKEARLLLRRGWSARMVAEKFGVHTATVRKWMRVYFGERCEQWEKKGVRWRAYAKARRMAEMLEQGRTLNDVARYYRVAVADVNAYLRALYDVQSVPGEPDSA